MELPPTLPARFLARPNRFTVVAELEGRQVRCFCPNPGRLRELLVEGASLRVAPAGREGRRTGHDALLVRHGRAWVGLDTRMASALFREGVEQGLVEGFPGRLVPEVRVGPSRLDFRVEGPRPGFVEVKTASLVVDGVAWFPDAPSERAARHAETLARLARRGRRAVLAFVIVRPDARALAPNEAQDPRFAAALRRAARAGVELRAFRCRTSAAAVCIAGEVLVLEVKEFLADAAEVYALSSDLARLVEARARADELVALPTIAPGPSELRAGAVLRRSPSLVVLRAGEVAARVPLAPTPGSRWVIGRSPRCQIPLGHDKRVSQQHAVVRWDAQRFCIQDLESRNGTFVNGERVASGAPRALAPGDILRAGDTALVFQ